jgi:hypothetical protein
MAMSHGSYGWIWTPAVNPNCCVARLYKAGVSPDNRQLAHVTAQHQRGIWVRIMPAAGGASRVIFRSSDRIRHSRGVRTSVSSCSSRQRHSVAGSRERGNSGAHAHHEWKFRNTQVHPMAASWYSTHETAYEFWLLENFLPESGK